MSLGAAQEEFTKHTVMLINHAWELGFGVRYGEVFRTAEQQKIYVQTGRSKTMNSSHLNRLAIDLVLVKGGKVCTHEQIMPLGEFWESLHPKNRWGGSWRGLVQAKKSKFIDAPHFERQL